MYQRTKNPHQLNVLIQSFELQQVSGQYSFWGYDDIIAVMYHYEETLNYKQALQVVDLALDRFPYQCDFYLQKSRLLALSSQIDQAMDVLDIALTIAPGEPEIRLLRSDIYCSVGKYHDAIACLDDVEGSVYGEDHYFLLIRKSKIYEAMKDFDLMFDTLKLVLEIDPDNHQALEEIWMSVEHSKRYSESIALHTSLIDQNPYSYLAWFNLGHAYSCVGDYKMAIEALEYSFIINSDFEAGYMDCAELCFQEREYKKAFGIYEDIHHKFGHDAENIVCMVECLLPLKKYAKARKLLLLALTLDPYNDEVHYYLGKCHAANQNWKEAIKAYNKAIKIDEGREEYLMAIAKCFGKVEKNELALHYYKKATSCAPEQNEYWVEYALFVKKVVGIEAALDVLTEAEEHSVGSDLSFQRATCMFELGLNSQAFSVLEEAMMDDLEGITQKLSSEPSIIENPKVKAMIAYYSEEI